MKKILKFQKNGHIIRNCQAFSNDNIHTVRYDAETIGHKAPFLANVPVHIKFAAALSDFEPKIKGSKCNSCTCAQFLLVYSSCNNITTYIHK